VPLNDYKFVVLKIAMVNIEKQPQKVFFGHPPRDDRFVSSLSSQKDVLSGWSI